MVLSAKQREARASRVGASEVAAILGEHPYMTDADVYDRIVDGTQRDASINMLVGAALEPHVLRLARDLLGLRGARACSRAYVHPTLPLCASPDAFCGCVGDPGLVEIKVTGAWSRIPGHVYWQVQTQMLLTGRTHTHVVALAGSMLTEARVEANPDDQYRIQLEVADFDIDHLRPRTRPVPPPFTFKETTK